ncbi:MAG: AAA family ATPase [Candidatus Scalindua sp.]|jgi:hypothetical protein|nr:AAA family ATPase [Candidatus Scalindua sp.]
MTELTSPSIEQQNAIDAIVSCILDKKPALAFIAPAGCGKTFCLKHIAEDERLEEIPMTFTATTNKAAGIIKEDLPTAMTLHKAISLYVATELSDEMDKFYDSKMLRGAEETVPEKIILDFLSEIGVSVKSFKKESSTEKFLGNNKISSYDHRIFDRYVTGEYQGGVCFIDESSMLPTKGQVDDQGKLKAIGLNNAMKVFDTVVLVGDDSQLPPINGTSSFEGLDTFRLTENHRSDQSLLRLLDYARNGQPLEMFVPREDEKTIRVYQEYLVPDSMYDMDTMIEHNITHIVYRNATRKSITRRIRGNDSQPLDGEPVVYKGANIDDEDGDCISKNETGVYIDGYGEWKNHKQYVNKRHFDEYSDNYCYLQFGYAITCHISQGSSFDYVIIHVNDIPGMVDSETERKWIYTSISRARKGVIIIK